MSQQAAAPDPVAGAGSHAADPPPRLTQPELEAAIAERQRHLAATLDELGRRLEPARLARTAAADARASAVSTVIDSRGALRLERVVAIAAALVVVVVTAVVAHVRTRRRNR